MSQRSLTIEIRYNFEDDSKEEIVRKAARAAARQLLTATMLISDRAPPDIAIHSEHFFEGREEVQLSEDESV